MNRSCDAVRPHLEAWVDGESTPLDPMAIAAHVASCARCRAEVEELRAYRSTVAERYRARAAPPAVRAAVLRARRRRIRPLALAAALLLVAAGAAAVIVALGGGGRRMDALAEMAVASHDAIGRGAVPLEFAAADAGGVLDWLRSRLPFAVALPRLDATDLRVEGASVGTVQGELAAVVEYRRDGAPVTLAIAAGRREPPRAAVSEEFRALRFHFSRLGGHNVISWTDRDLAYVLVSDLPSQGRASCTVCHRPGSGLRDVEGFHR